MPGSSEFFKRLGFRTLFPVIILVALVGVALNTFVLQFINEFEFSSIKEDLQWSSRFSQSIINKHYYDLIQLGSMGDERRERIAKGNALGELEDFMRQKNLHLVVLDDPTDRVLLNENIPEHIVFGVERGSEENVVNRVAIGGRDYFSYHVHFSPWNWHIILFQDVQSYGALMDKVGRAHMATSVILVMLAILLYWSLRVNVSRPIKRIISAVQRGKPPRYQGIREFEYLSESIAEMMNSLEEREGFLANVFNSIQDGISILDTDMRIVRVNRTMEEWYEHMSPLVGRKCYEIYHNRDRECDHCPSRETLDLGTISFGVVPRIGPSGDSTGWLELFTFPMLDTNTGQLTGVIEYVRDITERIRAEEQLRDSERRYRLLADNVTDIIWTMDMNLQWTYISPSVIRMRGYTVEEMMTRKLEDVVTPESYSLARQTFGEEIAREEDPGADPDRVRSLELEFYRKDGGTVWGEITASLLRDENGKAVGILGVTRDITKRKETEQALRESEERFRTAFRTSPDSININRIDDGVYVDINEGFTAISGYTREDVIGRSSLDLGIWVNMEDREKLVENLRKHGKMENLEAPFRMKDGTVLHGLMSAKIMNIHGEPHILSITRDITELKRAQDKLRDSLGEKSILLKEIHHRVKNNLQVISGLLNLQAHHIKDGETREVYKESQNRVITMALIHEELYQARDLAQVDFAAYIQNLASNLFISYGVKQELIQLALETEHFQMVVDTAIPCGLIVNELISNSLKHAFPDNREGTIRVDFRQTGDRMFQLIVSDDGIGLPEDMDVRQTRTLGLQLVTLLIDQLGATLEVAREEGTEFRISFQEYFEAGTMLY
jgi:PAS domain S-box-containing protein